MLIESGVHLPVSFAMLDNLFKSPDSNELGRIILRWLHFVAGITWIGMLYFFNLVNVPLLTIKSQSVWYSFCEPSHQ